LDTEPDMDNIAVGLRPQFLDKLIEAGVHPFRDTQQETKLFLARFEICRYGKEPTFPEAFLDDGSAGFIDFLAGFPIDCVEMLVGIGEFSSVAQPGEPRKVYADKGDDRVFPVVPSTGLFKWPEEDKILLNLTAIPRNYSKWFAENLEGEPKPRSPKWWYRTQLRMEGKKKFPIPGEFFGIGCRIFPGMYWGHQESNPFIYAGNFIDTVFYTRGIITEINEQENDTIYKVAWHGRKKEVEVMSSDYAQYEVGESATILKDVSTSKTSQLWKDADMKPDCDKTVWQIVPIGFYEETAGKDNKIVLS